MDSPAVFDAAAETARYLSTITPQAHAKAQAYTQGGHWLILGSAVVSLGISWLVIRSGVLVRIRQAIEGWRSRPWLASLAVLAVAQLLITLLGLPWSIYESWWRESQYGLTSQSLPGWLGEWAIGSAIGLVVGTLLMTVFYALLRRAPKTWWIWGSGLSLVFLVIGLVISPIAIEPIFNNYTPAPPGPVRDAVVELAKAHGVPSDKIFVYDGSKQSNRYTANVSGLFGSARVAMSDTMFKAGADMAEVRAVVAHEMGHYARQHILWQLGAMSLFLIIAFWLVDRFFAPMARLLGAGEVKGISDPAGYPVFVAVLVVIGVLGGPLMSSISRIAESDADNFSLMAAREPDGLARALMKTVEYRAATPGALEEALFYDHPAVGNRIRNGMDWKAREIAAGRLKP
ncbi:MAG: M48 family peptidase [Caulobacteraceae bacterium]|nr:M48 family peptidase [Caulobacteraceae bacterium]